MILVPVTTHMTFLFLSNTRKLLMKLIDDDDEVKKKKKTK